MPKIIDHEEMREDLLLKSFTLFARRGFHAVTMRQLARELEVSTGTLYHYFVNKNELYSQMLRTLVERDVTRVLSVINTGMAPAERLRIVLAYVSEKEDHFKNLLYLLFDFYRFRRGLADSNTLDEETERTNQFFQDLLATYRENIAENLGVANRHVGHLVTSVLIGTLVQRIVDPARVSLSEIQNAFEDFLGNPKPVPTGTQEA